MCTAATTVNRKTQCIVNRCLELTIFEFDLVGQSVEIEEVVR